jgi:hypothetical protein
VAAISAMGSHVALAWPACPASMSTTIPGWTNQIWRLAGQAMSCGGWLKLAEMRNNPAKSGLSARQERVLLALLSTPTHEAAAKQAGVSSRTLRKYLHDLTFLAAYRQRRAELVSAGVALAQQYYSEMIAVQITIAKDSRVSPATRVTAAEHVKGTAHKGVEEALELRVAALEKNLGVESYGSNRNPNS